MAVPSQTPRTAFSATVSLLHNNLTSSSGGWLACAHNSVNTGSGRILLNAMSTGASKDGPEVTNVRSIRFLEMAHGPVLCVSSANGTQVYSEDCTVLHAFLPINDTTTEADKMKFHCGSCTAPALKQIIVGTSKGTLCLLSVVAPDQYHALPESVPAGAATEVADVCFSQATNSAISVHDGGEIRVWTPCQTGPYVNSANLPASGQAPVRVASIGIRVLVAYGPGTICLYNMLAQSVQVEITAHARWTTGISVNEEAGLIASVGEDTVLNVWQVEPSGGQVTLRQSSVVADKLLTGVVFTGSGCAVTAYDTDEIFHVGFTA